MSEHTGTLWVILMTPKKNLLAKISSLQAYGKLKIEELKITYGRKNNGGWLFRIKNEPKARTFSFHDGDAIIKEKTGYVPFRKYSFKTLWVCSLMFLIACLCWQLNSYVQSPKAVAISPKTPIDKVSAPVEQKNLPSIPEKIDDPQMHKIFLESKRQFQYGQLSSSFIKLKKNIDQMNEPDQKEASNMLAEIYFFQCENWISQHEQRKAVIHCEKAVRYSDHPKASSFLNSQDEKARKFYLEGYTIQKFDPKGAKQKYSLVLQTSPTKSTWRGKAQYQLRKLKL